MEIFSQRGKKINFLACNNNKNKYKVKKKNINWNLKMRWEEKRRKGNYHSLWLYFFVFLTLFFWCSAFLSNNTNLLILCIWNVIWIFFSFFLLFLYFAISSSTEFLGYMWCYTYDSLWGLYVDVSSTLSWSKIWSSRVERKFGHLGSNIILIISGWVIKFGHLGSNY